MAWILKGEENIYDRRVLKYASLFAAQYLICPRPAVIELFKTHVH